TSLSPLTSPLFPYTTLFRSVFRVSRHRRTAEDEHIMVAVRQRFKIGAPFKLLDCSIAAELCQALPDINRRIANLRLILHPDRPVKTARRVTSVCDCTGRALSILSALA